MKLVPDAVDPGMVLGLLVVFLLFVCAVVIYRMRDLIPFPHFVARRLRCPHKGRKFTVEFSATSAVHYCSAFFYGELPCDRACATKFVEHANQGESARLPVHSTA
jgi:hypothetical protein